MVEWNSVSRGVFVVIVASLKYGGKNLRQKVGCFWASFANTTWIY